MEELQLNDWGGGSNAVTIRYNQFTNMTGGAPVIQLANMQNLPSVDVAWNETDNSPNQSAVGDNINIFNSSGTASSPINVHDNYVNGAYPNPADQGGYTGGGIILGDGGGNYQIAENNIVIRTTNYGVAIAGGTNVEEQRRRVFVPVAGWDLEPNVQRRDVRMESVPSAFRERPGVQQHGRLVGQRWRHRLSVWPERLVASGSARATVLTPPTAAPEPRSPCRTNPCRRPSGRTSSPC